MKVKRYKRVRKILQFYDLSYHLHAPYRVVVDPDFILACKQGKIMIKEQMTSLFHADTTVYITPCILHYLQQQGESAAAATFIAKTLSFLKCRHKQKGKIHPHRCIQALLNKQEEHIPEIETEKQIQTEETETIASVSASLSSSSTELSSVEAAAEAVAAMSDASPDSSASSSSSSSRLSFYNPDHLIVAAQHPELREWVRHRPGVPLLFVHGSVPVMEAPSDTDRFNRIKQNKRMRTQLNEEEYQAIQEIRRQEQPQPQRRMVRRKKKAKGPNPLSVKKKKKRPQKERNHITTTAPTPTNAAVTATPTATATL